MRVLTRESRSAVDFSSPSWLTSSKDQTSVLLPSRLKPRCRCQRYVGLTMAASYWCISLKCWPLNTRNLNWLMGSIPVKNLLELFLHAAGKVVPAQLRLVNSALLLCCISVIPNSVCSLTKTLNHHQQYIYIYISVLLQCLWLQTNKLGYFLAFYLFFHEIIVLRNLTSSMVPLLLTFWLQTADAESKC